MHIQYQKAIALFNERLRARNIEKEIEETTGFINITSVGMILFPQDEYRGGKDKTFSDYKHTVKVSMKRLLDGKSKDGGKLKWIFILCDFFDVDANFLCGQPSVYDDEFKQLINKDKVEH